MTEEAEKSKLDRSFPGILRDFPASPLPYLNPPYGIRYSCGRRLAEYGESI
jgi:hypothetical protein